MKKGDKLVCIDDSKWVIPGPKKGEIVTLKRWCACGRPNCGNHIVLVEQPDNFSFEASRFRKLEPKKPTNALIKKLAQKAKESVEIKEQELVPENA